MSYIPKTKWWKGYQKQCERHMKSLGMAKKGKQEFSRIVDPSIPHTLQIVQWLLGHLQEGSPFYWGDARCICTPEANGIFIQACAQEKQNIHEILMNHTITKQFKWVKCADIVHKNHENEVNRVDKCHYPELYANNVQMIQIINKEAKQNAKYKVYNNAILLYTQSLKRINEFVWETSELKLYYQMYIYKQLFQLTKNDLYSMIKYYKEMEHLMHRYMTRDLQKQLQKIKRRIEFITQRNARGWEVNVRIMYATRWMYSRIKDVTYGGYILDDCMVIKQLYNESIAERVHDRIVMKYCGNCLVYKTKQDGTKTNNKMCKGCKQIWYCSKRCQKIDWKIEHSNICLRL